MGPTVQRKLCLVKNFADTFYWNFWYIGFYWSNKYARESSEKSLEQKFVTRKLIYMTMWNKIFITNTTHVFLAVYVDRSVTSPANSIVFLLVNF